MPNSPCFFFCFCINLSYSIKKKKRNNQKCDPLLLLSYDQFYANIITPTVQL